MISVKKPGSPEDILEHFGKKGMKWGVRQSRAESKAFAKKYPTGRSRSDAIRRARANQIKRSTAYKTERNKAKKADLKKAFLKNPDRVTAARMTRGEKVVLGLVAGAGLAPAVAAAVGTQYTIRRTIESRQKRRKY